MISQVYVPDPAAVGQYMHEAAAELVRRGYRVVVLASARGYDDHKQKYPSAETLDGVTVRRLPLSSFGKSSIKMRLLGQMLFLAQVVLRGLFVGNLKGILVSTSPPMASAAALTIRLFRRSPIAYWVMDINPDQMLELGLATEQSKSVKVFNWLNRRILGAASSVIVLDRFMGERINRKLDVTAKMGVMPPWPMEGVLEVVEHAENPFRAEHGAEPDDLVIMYSGNHSVAHPLKTVVDASVKMRDRDGLKFFFVGGGLAKRDVEDAIETHGEGNLTSLPYQPMEHLKYSLSAADVHLVSVGNEAVGIVHPCKVYGAMAVARPLLLIGPDPCHVSDIIAEHRIGWHITHGDVDGAVRVIDEILATPRDELREMGLRAQRLVTEGGLGMETLRGRFCDSVERGFGRSV